jgi:hypothetical protein
MQVMPAVKDTGKRACTMTGREFQLGDTVAATTRNGRVHTGAIAHIIKRSHFTLVDVIDSNGYTLVFRLPEIKLIKEAE